MSNIHKLVIPKPRERYELYRQHRIVIHYIPDIKKWEWEVSLAITKTYNGKKAREGDALREAKSFIDRLLDGEK